jgi:hypothetical protein
VFVCKLVPLCVALDDRVPVLFFSVLNDIRKENMYACVASK